MTKDELKKKIVKVLKETINWTTDYSIPIGIVYKSELDKIADALIAAGIGDVSELKNHRIIAEYSLIPEDGNSCVLPDIPLRITQLYSGEEIEKIVKERDEYKHRAEVSESALQLMARGECTFASPEYYREQAEKELAEEGKND